MLRIPRFVCDFALLRVTILTVALVTLSGCGSGETRLLTDPFEVRTLTKMSDLLESWVLEADDPPSISLYFTSDEDWVVARAPYSGLIWGRFSIGEYLDVVRCYDGCGRTCTILNNTDRPLLERQFADVSWDPEFLAGLRHIDTDEPFELVNVEACAMVDH